MLDEDWRTGETVRQFGKIIVNILGMKKQQSICGVYYFSSMHRSFYIITPVIYTLQLSSEMHSYRYFVSFL